MAATFFERNAQAYKQWGPTRRNGGQPSGTVVIHTYEAPFTRSLLAAAAYLLQRTTPGGYHCIVGDDSPRDILRLAPWSAETWHCVPTNNWSVGISMIAYADGWASVPKTSRENLVKSAAYAASLYARWLKSARGITIPARRITRAQAMRREPGFISHGETDPGRRHDPGSAFDWDLFLDTYAALMGGKAPIDPPAPATPAPTPMEEFLMTLSDKQQQEMYDTLMSLRPGQEGSHSDGPGFAVIRGIRNTLRPIATMDRTLQLLRQIAPGKSGLGHHGDFWRDHIAPALQASTAEPTLDVDAAVSEIVDSIPDELIQRVADVIGDRVKGA